MNLLDLIVAFLTNLLLLLIAWRLGNYSINKYQEKRDMNNVISGLVSESNRWFSDIHEVQFKRWELAFNKDDPDFLEKEMRLDIEKNHLLMKFNAIKSRINLEFKSNIELMTKLETMEKIIGEFSTQFDNMEGIERNGVIMIPLHGNINILHKINDVFFE